MDKERPIRILSTRSLGEDVVQRIKRNKWHVDVVPMIETIGIPVSEDAASFMKGLSDERTPFMLVLTSMNGVKWLKRGLEKSGHSITRGITVLCVGKKTAARAAEQLKAVPLLIAPHGEALLALIKDHIPNDTRLIYVCARNRLDALPEGLIRAGYQLIELPVYETVSSPKKVDGEFDFVFFFSPSAVASFFEVNDWPEKAVGICIGETTAATLKSHGVVRVLTPSEPDEYEMIAVAERFLHKG